MTNRNPVLDALDCAHAGWSSPPGFKEFLNTLDSPFE